MVSNRIRKDQAGFSNAYGPQTCGVEVKDSTGLIRYNHDGTVKTVVELDATQTLTNKTLTNPTINGASGTLIAPTATSPAQTAEGSIVWDSNDDLLTVGDGSSRKIMVDTAGTQTLSAKTLTDPTINAGGGVIVLPGAGTPAQTAEGSVVWDTDDDVLTVGDGSGRKTMVDTAKAQTLTNKTLTAPVITNPTISGTTPLNVTAQTSVALGATHVGRTVTVDEADGVTFTLPAASGTGDKYRFFIGTTVTSNQVRFNVTGNDAMFGLVYMCDLDGSAAAAFAAGADADQLDLNGTTKGGVKGDWLTFEDVAADTWSVMASLQVPVGSNPASPFATGQVA